MRHQFPEGARPSAETDGRGNGQRVDREAGVDDDEKDVNRGLEPMHCDPAAGHHDGEPRTDSGRAGVPIRLAQSRGLALCLTDER
jgi:hypothetical protein